MVPRTVTTDWCTELGTTLLNGFINTTDNPAYFRCLNSLSVHHPIRLRKFLFHWSRHAGAPLLRSRWVPEIAHGLIPTSKMSVKSSVASGSRWRQR